jgi:hypothetical protein
MSVFESPDLESALQVLDLARADAVPIFPPEPDGYEGPQFGVA